MNIEKEKEKGTVQLLVFEYRKRKKRYSGSGHTRALTTDIIGSGHLRLPAATIFTTYPLACPIPFQISHSKSRISIIRRNPSSAAEHRRALPRRSPPCPPSSAAGRRGRTSPAGTAHHRAPSPSIPRAPSPLSTARHPDFLHSVRSSLCLSLSPSPLPSARYHGRMKNPCFAWYLFLFSQTISQV